jgi:hypothetical protein
MRDIMERKLRADGTGVAKIHDRISALEMGTLEQMVGLGYDVKGLFEEVTGHTMNQRTAVYKLLRKREGAPPGEGHAICQTGTKSLAELPRFVGDWADEPAVAGSRTVRGSDERPVPGRRLGKRIAPSMSMGPGLLYEARRSTLINHAPRIMPLTFGTPDGAP